MQTVSAEWMQNIDSVVRRQGFVDITITAGSKTIHICSKDDTGRNLSKTTHSRGYDPIGMSLPYNSLIIELFNYPDPETGEAPFDWLYNDYEYSHLPVVIKYGFCLESGDETILGGNFITTGINKDGDMLSIECSSTFEVLKDLIIRKASDTDAETVLFSLYGEYKTSVSGDDLSNQEIISTFSEIKSMINAKGVSVISNTALDNTEIYVVDDTDYTIGKAVQYISNTSLQRCYINRENILMFEPNGKPPVATIKQLNMRSKPVCSRGALLKNIECTTKSDKTDSTVSTSTYNRRYGEGSVAAGSMGFEGENKVYYRDYVVDWTNNIITDVSGNIVKIARSKIAVMDTEYSTEFGANVVVDTGQTTPGIKIWCYGSGIPIVSYRAKFSDVTIVSEDYHNNGIICDIKNPYGPPADFDKIAAYYDNRDIYEFDLRGDPAVDIGDYVWASLTDDDNFATYKKALILESELTFDGSFKDTMKVRIIDNDFEEIAGNTHADLAKYSHARLGNYTHKQLMTEVI